MATRVATIPPSAQLCDFCHQKPKFSNHQFCSKTCASQASTSLCKHCHKKPKFQNFDYCGKNCAALASPMAMNAAQQPQAPLQKAAANNSKVNPSRSFNPVHVAKLVAQQIPQAFSNIGSAAQPTQQPAGQTVAGNAAQAATPNNNPFLNLTNAQQQPPQINGVHSSSGPLPCLIPGCGKPVHVDAQGNTTSDYCSRKHREEAVALGLASPCIMCLTMPQSDMDYFCGKACRDEALNKI